MGIGNDYLELLEKKRKEREEKFKQTGKSDIAPDYELSADHEEDVASTRHNAYIGTNIANTLTTFSEKVKAGEVAPVTIDTYLNMHDESFTRLYQDGTISKWMMDHGYNDFSDKTKMQGLKLITQRAKNLGLITTNREEEKWFKAGAFEDGYDFGDLSKTILGSVGDLGENIVGGFLDIGEAVVDTGAYLVGTGANILGADDFAEDVQDFIKRDLYNGTELIKGIDSPLENIIDTEDDSIFAEKSDSLAQSAGQLLGTAGLQAAGVPWWVTSGVTSFGGEVENAFNQGATYEQAALSGIVTAGAEILTEKISGGFSFGGKTLDNVLTKRLATGIANKTMRTVLKLGVDTAGEGLEEVFSNAISAIGQKLTYDKDKDTSIKALLFSEEAADAFIGGAVLGFGSSSVNTVKSNKLGVDSTTGLTKSEESVFNKVYEAEIEAEAKKKGEELTNKEKDAIYDKVMKDLEKGRISTDIIEEVLGGETYKSYQAEIDKENSILEQEKSLNKQIEELLKIPKDQFTVGQNEQLTSLREQLNNLDKTTNKDALKSQLGSEVFEMLKGERKGQGSYLLESYNEQTRRGQSFEADLSKYDSKQAEIVKKAIDSGFLNNTNRTHEFVDMVAKISADKGVSFDFTNNEKLKESGFAIDGKSVNGYYSNGNITVNMNSAKALDSVVGHEVTHVLEGTELYNELQKTIIEYSKTKGDYQKRLDTLKKLYEGVKDADINAELTADLVGDYLFTDEDFVRHLSTTNRNVFKKIFDEIKYLYKIATAGSKEARQLEEVKHTFEKVWRESGKAEGETKYHLSENSQKPIDKYSQKQYNDFGWARDVGAITKNELDDMYSKIQEKPSLKKFEQSSNGEAIIEVNDNPHTTLGVDNVFVFVTGTKNNPQISRVVRFQAETDAEMVIIKENLYERGSFSDTYYSFLKQYGIAREYSKKSALDYFGYEEKIRRGSSGADRIQTDEHSGNEQNGSGTFAENQSNEIAPINEASSKDGVFFDGKYSLSDGKESTQEIPLEQRLSGDALLNAEDLIADIEDVAEVSPNGYVTVYHRTTEENAKRILESGKMSAKEDGIFFSTQKSGVYSFDYGKGVVELKVPVEKLVLDDIFDSEAHLKIPLKNKNEILDISAYLTKSMENHKEKQFEIIQETNPMWDDYHTGIRSTDDIRTWEEVLELNDESEGQFIWGDFSRADAEQALKDGTITVYSSYPIKNGVFVSTSYVQAQEYAGGKNGKVYSKTIPLTDVAWINGDEGQYASVEKDDIAPTKYSLSDSEGKRLTQEQSEYFKDSKVRDDKGNLLKVYHGTRNGNFTVFNRNHNYFTDSKEMADSYSPNGDMFEGYLNIVNPFEIDAEGEKWSKVPIDEETKNFLQKYGAGVFFEDGRWRTSPADIVGAIEEAIEEGELDYDGVIIKNVDDTGNYFKDKDNHIATDYITFNSNQFKNADNTKPTVDKDIRHSLGESTQKGRFYGKDMLLQGDIAPVGVAKNTTTTSSPKVDTISDEIAPVVEDTHIAEDLPIKTVKEKLEAKMSNKQEQLAKNQEAYQNTMQSYSEKISTLRSLYEGKKNKDTKAANKLLQRIARLERLQADLDVDYSKKIGDIKSQITKTESKLQEDHTKEDRLEKEYIRINNRLTDDKVALANEFEQKKKQLQSEIADRDAFVSTRAYDLYKEISNLKKGVRASQELGFILDHGFEWKSIKTALINAKNSPNKTVNPNSSAESVIRELLNEEYENKAYELDELDTEYQERINELEKGAEKERAEARKKEQRVLRSELHQSKVDNVKAQFSKNGYDFDKVLKEAKNLSTFSTVDNTPQRVMEKALGYKEGQILADLTVNKVAQNETERIKWINYYLNSKNGVLPKLSRQYNIKPFSNEDAAAMMYAEGFYVNKDNEIIQYGDNELAIDFPDAKVRENIKGLARDPRFRQIYDKTLGELNVSRARNAYPEIPRLDNYYLHFKAMDDTFSKLGLPFNPNDIRAKDLPTDLNGVTADLKPGQPYFASAKHREGIKTSYSLLGGLERYLTSASNQIYHIDDIQTLRALRNYIADTYGQANGLEGLDALTEEEAEEKIKQVYNSHLSTFAKFLNEEANIIAGKTALIDRGIEGIIGRRGITFLDSINKQVGANMVGFNVSSSLTNFLAPVQAFAKTNKTAFVKGFAQTVSNRLNSIVGKSDGFAENSPVVIRRKGADRFHRTPFQKVGDAGYVLMGAVDNISTEIIARAKYNELTAKGMDSETAHIETDKWVSRLMGDRSLGQMPQLYNSKMLGLITKFQLEVRNQLDSQFYDTIQETKADNADIENALKRNSKTAAKVALVFTELAIAQHLFGKAFEAVAGYNPAFDIIEVLMTAFGLDDDEESEDTTLDNIEQGFMELLGDLPYASTFVDGGRIPIGAALPLQQFVTGKDKYGNEKSRLETLGEIAPYYFMPGGYGQLKKTIGGLSMFSDEHPIAGSYTDSGKLRFPVEDTFGNRLQAAIFGQYASGNARDYFDNDIAPLNEKQTQEFINVNKTGMSIQDYWNYRKGLSGLKTLAEKADYINSLDLTDKQKNILINNIADRKEDIDMTDYGNYGSFEEFDFANKYPNKYAVAKSVGGYDAYKTYTSALYDIKADKDANGKTISGSRKAKVADYINSLNVDYGTKIILFKSEYPSDNTYNYDICEYLNNRDDISWEQMETILIELGFKVDSQGYITWD